MEGPLRTQKSRPCLERLEDRLPPGDAFLSLIVDPTLFEATFIGSDGNLTASSKQVVSETAVAKTWLETEEVLADMGSGSRLGPLPPYHRLPAASTATGLGSIGAAFVNLGLLDGSFAQIGSQNLPFGDPQGSDQLRNVRIIFNNAGAGTISIRQSDIQLPEGDVVFLGATVHYRFRPQSNGTGTYNLDTGAASAQLSFDVHITTNDLPGFNNNTCIIPTVSLDARTQTGGTPFSGGVGAMRDQTFAIAAIPTGRCGSNFVFGDYATLINNQLGLPSPSGSNIVHLRLRMNAALPPA